MSGTNDDLIAEAAATLPKAEQERALDALVAFTHQLNTMMEHAARGVRVAPFWRDPEQALRAEAKRLEELADVAAVVFIASADHYALLTAFRRSWTVRWGTSPSGDGR